MFQEAEEAAIAKENKKAAHAAAAAAREAAAAEGSVAKSPSDFSCHSYELFVGQEKGNTDDNNKEKMSIRSDSLSQGRPATGNKVRKVSAVSFGLLRSVLKLVVCIFEKLVNHFFLSNSLNCIKKDKIFDSSTTVSAFHIVL